MSDISYDDLRKIYKKTYAEKCKKYPDMEENNVLNAVPRIIAIGDLHGDYEETIKILEVAKVAMRQQDTSLKTKIVWTGGNTVVVQVGDQIDRCRELPCVTMSKNKDENSDIRILELLTELNRQAMKKGGAFYSLVGNHELMNVDGRTHYVSPLNYKGFEKDELNAKYLKDMPDHKKDMDAREWAFKPGNPIAEFLACTRKMVLKIGSTLFVHAGILPEIANKYKSLGDINKIMSLYLWKKLDDKKLIAFQDLLGPDIVKGQTIINPGNLLCEGPDCFNISPLWNREIGNLPDHEQECEEIFKILKDVYNVDRMVVGHTPKSGISFKCDNKLIYVDYAASSAFDIADRNVNFTGKRSEERLPQVLEILNDKDVRVLKSKEDFASINIKSQGLTPKRLASPTRKVSSRNRRHSSPTRKVSSRTRRHSSPTRRLSSPTRRLSSPTRRLSSPTRRLSSPTSKVSSSKKKSSRSRRKSNRKKK
jgi:hypothetical protein